MLTVDPPPVDPLIIVETSDDRGRKSDLIYGFFCHDDSLPMSSDAAEELIGKVSLGARR